MGFGLIIQHRSQVPQGGGRNQSECPAGMLRNRWPEWIGISGRNGPEYADFSLLYKTIQALLQNEWVKIRLKLANSLLF
jgi:hypothetical protein